MVRGIVESTLSLYFLFKNTIGDKNKEATKKRNRVKEIESIMPESFAEARNEPATKKVASNTNK
jgi:hypothetical protein